MDIRATKNLLDAVRTQININQYDQYEVVIGNNLDINNNPIIATSQILHYSVTIHEHVDNNQYLYGTVNTVSNGAPGTAVAFSYRDLAEPVTLGVLAVVVVGVGAVTCVANQVIGLVANQQCKKVETVYGFKFNFKNPVFGSDIGCHVRCIDK
jgi:hypothetical protein